jgi:hypothetical protein
MLRQIDSELKQLQKTTRVDLMRLTNLLWQLNQWFDYGRDHNVQSMAYDTFVFKEGTGRPAFVSGLIYTCGLYPSQLNRVHVKVD